MVVGLGPPIPQRYDATELYAFIGESGVHLDTPNGHKLDHSIFRNH
jgi:hypothetical protein